MRMTFIGLFVLVVIPSSSLFLPESVVRFDWAEVAFGLVICFPALAALFFRQRLSQVALVATSGFGLVVAFAFFSALDLGMTQLMVESLSILFIFFLVRSLNQKHPSHRFSLLDTLIALGASCLLVFLILVEKTDLPLSVSQYFLDNSYVKGFWKKRC